MYVRNVLHGILALGVFSDVIYITIKTRDEFRNVSVTVTVGVVEVGVFDTRYGVSQPTADAER